MKPARPIAHVTIAGRRLSAAEAAMSDLVVSMGRFSHDRVRLLVWPSSKFAQAAVGSEMKIELGTEDSETDVWTGKVSAVDASPDAIGIEGLTATAALSSERKSQTYVNQGAVDIVRDLAGSVTVDDADTDLQLDYYAVDHRRSVWGHLVDLAILAGAETTVSATGGLRFVQLRVTPASTSLRYGADVLGWQVGPVVAPQAAAYAVHGSASDAGKEKWHWIRQQVASTPARIVGAFHSQSSADGLNTVAADSVKRSAVRGRLQLVGMSDLRAGDVFKVEELPGADPVDLRALAVTHHFNGRQGFWTSVIVEGGGA